MSDNFTNSTRRRKIGLIKARARTAAVTSKLRFKIPPVGGKAAVSTAPKKAELADRVADFIERTPLMLAIGRDYARGA